MVCGDGRHFLSALVTLKPDVLAEFAASKGLPAERLHRHPDVLQTLHEAIDEVNQHHARVAHVRKFTVIERSLTIDLGELTPTMKVRRRVVLDKFRDAVDEMYRE